MACSVRCYSIGEGEYEQHFMPRLIIGDNVSLSKYVHNFPPYIIQGNLELTRITMVYYGNRCRMTLFVYYKQGGNYR